MAKQLFDAKTWGYIKLVGGLVAFWFAWKAGIGANAVGSIAILAAIAFLSGLNYVSSK